MHGESEEHNLVSRNFRDDTGDALPHFAGGGFNAMRADVD